MTDFKKLSFSELCDKLTEKKRTIIIYHIRSDADAVGSAFALREILTLMGIPTLCACSDEVPLYLRFISEFSQGSVLLDDGLDIGHERVISVDSASPEQLGDIYNKLHKDIDIMIDHHGEGKIYADNYIEPDAASTAEIIYKILKELKHRGVIYEVPPRVYEYIYAGLSADTGCFKYANVTPETHLIAAELLREGVDAARINHLLFSSKSLKQIRAEGEASRRITLYDEGRIAITTMPYSLKYSLGLTDDVMGAVIDIPRSISGVEIAAFIRQSENNGIFRASLRSVGDIDVSRVCATFGGGGHKRAAGCTIEAQGIEDAERKLVSAIRSYLKTM